MHYKLVEDTLSFETWNLEPGTWNLEPGIKTFLPVLVDEV